MAKVIKYQFVSCEVNRGTEQNPVMEQIILDKKIACQNQAAFDVSYPIAEKEAVPGTIEVSGEFDGEEVVPSAQEDNDAMLIDHEYRLTLLELGLAE